MRTETQAIDAATLSRYDDLGKLVLRLALGLMLLLHGIAKLVGGIGFVTGALQKLGLPEAIGYLVYVGEVIAPLLIVFGLWTRLGALIVAGNMIVAVLLVHTAQLFALSATGGWELELQGMFFFAAVALILLGAGRYSIGGRAGRWN
ncbi:MAG TPA: GntR family transcriptional regulator [Massilia sp.]|jgi:putative oxidoreductase|nr:GntR family transcriptional regulator [Massilia sp.]